MATTAIPGFTGQMFLSTAVASSSAPAGTPIAELMDVTLSITRDEMEAFSKDSAGWDEVIYGKGKVSITGKAIYHDTTSSTGVAMLWDAITTRANVGATIRGSATSGIIQYTVNALVNKWDLSHPLNGVQTADFGLRVTGAPVRFPSTS